MSERTSEPTNNNLDSKQHDTKSTNIHGRLDDTANPEFKEEENQPDISQVDRQEGTMNNGELGGNFRKPDTKEE